MALVKMAEEFGGLPMESLIGGPLQAACDAQTMLAGATAPSSPSTTRLKQKKT